MATKTRKTTAKPKAVDTLVKWSKYYGKKSNVQFDPDTREPIVFSEDGTTVAKRFAWERKADMVTILGNPEGFKPTWSDIAVRRLGKLTTPILESRRQTEEQLREAEQRLLSLWSNYATPELRRAHQMEIIDAENAVRLLESNLYNESARTICELSYKPNVGPKETYNGIYDIPIQLSDRGIPVKT